MSLNWDLQKVNRKETGKMIRDCDDASCEPKTCTAPQQKEIRVHTASGEAIPWAVTNGLIWATMAVQMHGMDDVKEAREFAVRVAIYQRLFGAWLNGENGPRPITTAEVMAHQGLRTNVSTKTRGQFLKAMSEQLAREIAEDVADELLKTPDNMGAQGVL